MPQNFIHILIITHASFGGIALLSGLIALVTAKGRRLHKKAGTVFYYTMLAAALLAIIIALIPDHISYFLLVVGIFSTYMILSGKRILKLKHLYRGEKPVPMEFILPAAMLIAAVVMTAYGIFLYANGNTIGIVLMVFGGIGGWMSSGDIRLLRNKPADKRFWLYKHISKMTGGYIAATTAFLVVNQVLPMLWGWLLPTVIGTIYIIYHQVRFKRKGEKILTERNIE